MNYIFDPTPLDWITMMIQGERPNVVAHWGEYSIITIDVTGTDYMRCWCTVQDLLIRLHKGSRDLRPRGTCLCW